LSVAAGTTAGVAIGTARRLVAQALREAAVEAPELDARILVGHAVGLDHTGLAAAATRPLTMTEAETLATLVARRLAHEPVARIVGVREFWGLPFRLTPDTLVPRPDSETVVEAALAALDAGGGRATVRRLADIGTGSGALLLALLSELPQASGVGTDLNVRALAAARRNARDLGLAARAQFVACDFGGALAGGGLDLVVSNPPYVTTGQIATLAPEVRDYEPAVALDGGTDGLAAYRDIAVQAGRLLAPGGLLIVEIGFGQAGDVTAIFRAAGLMVKGIRNDLAGVPRALLAGHG
jgi:release factor glutamine methyltransferase